jgi:hypothetical protein
MTDEIKRWLIGAVQGFLLGLALGWTANGWRLAAALEQQKNAHSETLLAAEQAATAALIRARTAEALGESLAQKRLEIEAQNQKLSKERDHALRKVTTGRACLDGAALRLLNDTGALGGGHVPASPGGAAGPAAGLATDTDVALWTSHARDQHDLCRGRLDALRAWYQATGGDGAAGAGAMRAEP